VKEFRDVLVRETGRTTVKIETHRSIFRVGYCGNINAVKIRDFLYRGANQSIWLDRKRDTFYGDWLNERPMASKCRPVIMTNKSGDTYFDAITDVTKAGFDRTCVFDCLSGRSKTHKGTFWRYATEEEKLRICSISNTI
jgi:hypothetical protein